MTIDQITDAYADELEKWDFFSDGQRCYVDENSHIVVCLRNYNWYITKEPITDIMTCIKALFEIDWIAEYEDGEEDTIFIDTSKYWNKF